MAAGGEKKLQRDVLTLIDDQTTLFTPFALAPSAEEATSNTIVDKNSTCDRIHRANGGGVHWRFLVEWTSGCGT